MLKRKSFCGFSLLYVPPLPRLIWMLMSDRERECRSFTFSSTCSGWESGERVCCVNVKCVFFRRKTPTHSLVILIIPPAPINTSSMCLTSISSYNILISANKDTSEMWFALAKVRRFLVPKNRCFRSTWRASLGLALMLLQLCDLLYSIRMKALHVLAKADEEGCSSIERGAIHWRR